MNMLYSKDIKKAMNLAYNVHNGQLDKSGYPYIAHPLHVAEKMSDEASTILALLHDIVEDTNVTFEQLENLEFKTDVITALKLLTHDDNISYFDYINNMKDNSLAKQVKIADLEHNMELSRLDVITEKDIRRAEKYRKALNILKSL